MAVPAYFLVPGARRLLCKAFWILEAHAAELNFLMAVGVCNLHILSVQDDTSGWSKPIVDIDLKVAF